MSADSHAAFEIVISSSVSLAAMVVDFLWLVRDEIKFVWPRIRCSWRARMYMVARYCGMISQIFNVYFTFRMYRGIQTSPWGCSVWFAYQAIVTQFLLTFAEGLLMHRIYAIFLRNRLILYMLLMFAGGQVASMGVSARFSLPNVRHTDTCIILSSPPGNAYFGATTLTTNIIIFIMTFGRYFHLPTRWTQQGIGRVVMRDSALSILAISIVMLFLTLCALRVIRPSISGNITYYWLVCVLWVSIGRIIINHEKLPREEREGRDALKEALQITSRIELGEMSQLSIDLEGSNTMQSTKKSPWEGSSPQSTIYTSEGTTIGDLPAIVQPAHVRVPRYEVACMA